MGNIYYIIQYHKIGRDTTCVVIFQILVDFAIDGKTVQNQTQKERKSQKNNKKIKIKQNEC